MGDDAAGGPLSQQQPEGSADDSQFDRPLDTCTWPATPPRRTTGPRCRAADCGRTDAPPPSVAATPSNGQVCELGGRGGGSLIRRYLRTLGRSRPLIKYFASQWSRIRPIAHRSAPGQAEREMNSLPVSRPRLRLVPIFTVPVTHLLILLRLR